MELKSADLRRYDLNLLVVLDALLDEVNVTRAGERVHLSQSATSAALKAGCGMRTICSTSLLPWKMGCTGRGSTADAVQSMNSVLASTGTVPWSSSCARLPRNGVGGAVGCWVWPCWFGWPSWPGCPGCGTGRSPPGSGAGRPGCRRCGW